MSAKKIKPKAATKGHRRQPTKAIALGEVASSALTSTGDFATLVERVVGIIEEAQARVVRAVNSAMVLSYWHIGREIVEYVQRGEARAEYGEQVIEDLSAQLLARVGRGYSTRNLWYFRDFYLTYRGRTPSIRATEFRTSLVQNSKRLDPATILHEAGAGFTEGFSSRLARASVSSVLRRSRAILGRRARTPNLSALSLPLSAKRPTLEE